MEIVSPVTKIVTLRSKSITIIEFCYIMRSLIKKKVTNFIKENAKITALLGSSIFSHFLSGQFGNFQLPIYRHKYI